MTAPITRTFSLVEIKKMAVEASRDLDGIHGDPSKAANWIRERTFARVLIALIDRAVDDVEVQS